MPITTVDNPKRYAGTGDGLLTVLTSPTDYTPQVGEYLFIWLAMELTQGETFPNVTASIRSPILRQLDRMALMIQDLQAQIDQAVRASPTDLATISGTMFLPLDSTRAGKLLSFDSRGNPGVTAPGDLGNITAGDTLPIDAATAVVFKTGAASVTLRFILDALTAARTITMPDANVDLGLLLATGTAFGAGDVGKVIKVSGTGAAVSAEWDVGQPVAGCDVLGDASGTYAFGTTKGAIRTGTSLTAARTFAMVTTGVAEGTGFVVLRDDDGAFDLTVTGTGSADSTSEALGPRETGLFRFLNGHWRLLGRLSTNRAIDMRGGVLKAPKLTAYTEDATDIASASGVLTIDMTKPVQRFAMTENVTQVLFINKSTDGAQGPVIDIIQGAAPYTIDPDGWPDETVFLTDTPPDTAVLGEGSVMRLVLEFSPLDSTTVRVSYDSLQSWLNTARSYPLAQATSADQPAISDTAAPGLLVPEFGATDNLTAVAVPGVQIMAWMVVGRVTSMQTGGRTVASRSTKA